MDEPRSKKPTIILASVFGVVLLGGALRLSPWCLFDAGPAGWSTWTRALPNLACSLDLSGQNVSAEDLERLGGFGNLESLNLSNNGLTSVPSAVSGLTSLKNLDLSGNAIASLPDDLGNLEALVNLDASDNELTAYNFRIRGGGGGSLSVNLSGNGIGGGGKQQTQQQNPGVTISFDPPSSSSSSSAGGASPPAPPGSGAGSSAGETGGSTSSAANGSSGSSTAGTAGSAAASSIVATASSQGVTASVTNSSAGAASSSPAAESSAASSVSAGAAASAATASSAASSAAPEPTCDPNYSINGYSFCVPDTWTANGQGEFRENGVVVAQVECPMQQASYDEWDLTTRSRTYLKNGQTYGADEWRGVSRQDGSALLLVFMHRHSLDSWFGENYADVSASCQILSLRPAEDQAIFRMLYLSVH